MNAIKIYFFKSLFAVSVIFIPIMEGNAQTIKKLDKVSHVEPLYLDLVRDLGARKGERELNVAADFRNIKNYNEHMWLVEYEFAPINRLGLEVEADFSFFKRKNYDSEIPNNKLECLRSSAQYSFLVLPKHNTTMAVGYTQIVEFTDFKNYGKKSLFTSIAYNPFFVAAKRWGSNLHTLIYMGPLIEYSFSKKNTMVNWQINTSIHYSIPKTKHFIGVEFNKEINHERFEMTIRPQVKLKVNESLAIGFVTGFPINRGEEGYSSFIRVIYEL